MNKLTKQEEKRFDEKFIVDKDKDREYFKSSVTPKDVKQHLANELALKSKELKKKYENKCGCDMCLGIIRKQT